MNGAGCFKTGLLAVELGPGFPLGKGLACRADVFGPAGPPRALVVCFPGGGYARSYHDLHFPGRVGYSLADTLAAAGYAVVVADHLGSGESSHPDDAAEITPELMAQANSCLTREVWGRYLSGQLTGCAPASAEAERVIGVGHSAGGGLLVMQQALFDDFEALICLGFSAIRMPTSAEMNELQPLEMDPGATTYTRPLTHPGYGQVGRGPIQHHWYHWDDVPDDIIAADDQNAVEFPPCMSLMNQPGYVLENYAPLVRVPVRLLAGERDLRLPDSNEPSAYPNASSVEFWVQPRSGHCQWLASSRALGFAKVRQWCDCFSMSEQ
jgi:pimeloyl-ACP methyl ester carboxylesterase